MRFESHIKILGPVFLIMLGGLSSLALAQSRSGGARGGGAPVRGGGSGAVGAPRPRPNVRPRGGGFYAPYSVPYGYTALYPGPYDPNYYASDPNAPAYPLTYNPEGDAGNQGPTPTVIINQNFQAQPVNPRVIDYSGVPMLPPGPFQQPAPAATDTINGEYPLVLIAMKDHTINPCLAYWVEGNTLNYVMEGGRVNHASLDAVDRELSIKLNTDRRVNFHLPEAK